MLTAAFELLTEKGLDFTVQDLVDRSACSLRAYYQEFGGKERLFLAMFERVIAVGLSQELAAVEAAGPDPVDRLRAFVASDLDRLAQSRPELSRALAVYYDRLAESCPDDLVAAMRPMHEVLVDLVGACRNAGRIDTEMSDETWASLLLHWQMSVLVARILDIRHGGQAFAMDDVWTVMTGGLIKAPTNGRTSSPSPASARKPRKPH